VDFVLDFRPNDTAAQGPRSSAAVEALSSMLTEIVVNGNPSNIKVHKGTCDIIVPYTGHDIHFQASSPLTHVIERLSKLSTLKVFCTNCRQLILIVF
jgi:hypothetical protein